MVLEEYRQESLPGFDSLELIREYFIPSNEDRAADADAYVLTPENFLDAIENRIESVHFANSSWYLGHTVFNRKVLDSRGRPKVELTMAADSPHERQAKTLAHEMTHVDRRRSVDADYDNFVEIVFSGTDKEEELISQAANEFYRSHLSLAKIALSHVWKRYKEETKAGSYA